MASLVARQASAFGAEWLEKIEAELKKNDPSKSKEVPKHDFLEIIKAGGVEISSIMTIKLTKDYGFGNVIQYERFLIDLKNYFKSASEKKSGEQKQETSGTAFAYGGSGKVVVEKKHKILNIPKEEKDLETPEPKVDKKVALAEFRSQFDKWARGRYQIDYPAAEVPFDNELKDKYARLFFALIAEEDVRKQRGGCIIRNIEELSKSIPDWPSVSVSFHSFKKVCKKLLDEPKYLAQLFSKRAVPGKTIHTTMTYQQFAVTAVGVTKVSITRMIDSLNNASNSSIVGLNNTGAGGSLHARFNTWKDVKLGIVSGKSLLEGIKTSIPLEPKETVLEFVKKCLRKDAREDNFETEPAQFSQFGDLIRSEGKHVEGAKEIEPLASAPDSELIRSVRDSVLEACEYNPDKVYDMLVFAAINNPPYKPDVLTIDAVIRAITTGIGVRLSTQQQAIIGRILRENIKGEGDAMPIGCFLKQFDILPKGAPTSIPPAAIANERCGRFGHQLYNGSDIMTPIIPKPNTTPTCKSRTISSEGVTSTLEMEGSAPVTATPTVPIVPTGVDDSLKLGPKIDKLPPGRVESELDKTLRDDEKIREEKTREMLEQAAKAEETRKNKGINGDIYRAELPPPSRSRGRGNESARISSSLNWTI